MKDWFLLGTSLKTLYSLKICQLSIFDLWILVRLQDVNLHLHVPPFTQCLTVTIFDHIVPVEVGLPYLPTSVYSSCSMWTHNSLSASSLPHNSWVEAVYHYSYSQVCRSRLLVCPCLSVSSSSIRRFCLLTHDNSAY